MKIYFDRHYHNRYGGALVSAIVLIAMGCISLWGLDRKAFADEVSEMSLAIWLVQVVIMGIAGVFFYAGCIVAYRWMTNRIDRLKITEEGIEHFGKLITWGKVKRLSCKCQGKGHLMLFYQLKGLGFDRFLPVTGSLSETEIASLFRELNADVSPRFPDLKIG